MTASQPNGIFKEHVRGMEDDEELTNRGLLVERGGIRLNLKDLVKETVFETIHCCEDE